MIYQTICPFYSDNIRISNKKNLVEKVNHNNLFRYFFFQSSKLISVTLFFRLFRVNSLENSYKLAVQRHIRYNYTALGKIYTKK